MKPSDYRKPRGPCDNLLIAETLYQGAHALIVFGLDPAEWYVVGVGEPLLGRRFSRIIVLPLQYNHFSAGEAALRKNYVEVNARCRLSVDGELTVL